MHRIVLIGQRASASPTFSLVDLPGTSGRLDVLVRSLRAALLVSHGLRHDAVAYLVMLGDPLAPRTLRIDGSMARFLRPDERQLAILVQKALVAVPPGTSEGFSSMRRGIDVADGGVETVLRDCVGSRLFMLDERGADVRETAFDVTSDCTFFIGDHMGFDAQTVALLKREGAQPLSLGPMAIHAEDAVAVLWNELDRRAARARLSCVIPQRRPLAA